MPQIHKGDRDAMTTRPAHDVGAAVRRRAKEHGVSVSDYIAIVLSSHVGMPQLAPVDEATVQRAVDQSELPLTG